MLGGNYGGGGGGHTYICILENVAGIAVWLKLFWIVAIDTVGRQKSFYAMTLLCDG